MDRAAFDPVGLEMFYPSNLTSSPLSVPKQQQHQQQQQSQHYARRNSSSSGQRSMSKEHTKGVPSPKPVLDADGKIIYRRERRAFTADEDVRLIKGFDRHGPSWTKIQRDRELDFSTRRSTDLRDRFRNAFPAQYAAAGFKARPPKTAAKRTRTTSAGALRSAPSPGGQPPVLGVDQQVRWAPISYGSSSSNASSVDAPSVTESTVHDRRAASQAARSMSLDSGFYSGTSTGSATQLESWPDVYGSYLIPSATGLPPASAACLPVVLPAAVPALPLQVNDPYTFFEQAPSLGPLAQAPVQAQVFPDDDSLGPLWQPGPPNTLFQTTDDLSLRYGLLSLPGP